MTGATDPTTEHYERVAQYPEVRIAWDRAEDEPCERGTVGCSVIHDGEDTRCETW